MFGLLARLLFGDGAVGPPMIPVPDPSKVGRFLFAGPLLYLGAYDRTAMLLPIVTIFTGSFLLFLVQPMFARLLLPAFGSSAAVWVTCLATYELLLVAGYGYGTLFSRPARRRRLGAVHSALLLLSAVWFAVLAEHGPFLAEVSNAWTSVLLTVCVCIAVPYVLLSANATLVQSAAPSKKGAFWLYGVSNLGSFCGLLAFPLGLEPNWSVGAQLGAFAAGLVLYAVLVASLTQRRRKSGDEEDEARATGPGARASGPFAPIAWLVIPAVSSALLTATTAFVCSDVSPLPLLWVVFLAIFLLSYAVGFNAYAEKALPLLAVCAAFALFPLAAFVQDACDFKYTTLDLLVKVKRSGLVSFAAVLLFLHTWLYSLRPGKERLGRYYFFNAVGGAAGGLFAGIAAPQLFADLAEYRYALWAASLLVFVWAVKAAVPAVRAFLAEKGKGKARLPVCPILAILLLFVFSKISSEAFRASYPGTVRRGRDFYGSLVVVDGQKFGRSEGRMLFNGRTHHGYQVATPSLDRLKPTTYYGDTGGGLAVSSWRKAHPGAPLRYACVGLGAGTMAVWAEPGDTFAFYEISPEDIRIARDPALFTFLSDCRGSVEIREGDGRKLLEAEDAAGAPGWDVLEIDAFSGDAIPLQLISDEAFDLFRRRLAPGGILSLHVSNWQFDLLPVMKRQMERLGLAAVATIGPESGSRYLDETSWVHYAEVETVPDAVVPPDSAMSSSSRLEGDAGAAASRETAAEEGSAEENVAGGAGSSGEPNPITDPFKLFDISLLQSGPGGAARRPPVEPAFVALGAYTLALPPRSAQIPWDKVPDGSAVTDAKGSLLPLMTDRVREALLSF